MQYSAVQYSTTASNNMTIYSNAVELMYEKRLVHSVQHSFLPRKKNDKKMQKS